MSDSEERTTTTQDINENEVEEKIQEAQDRDEEPEEKQQEDEEEQHPKKLSDIKKNRKQQQKQQQKKQPRSSEKVADDDDSASSSSDEDDDKEETEKKSSSKKRAAPEEEDEEDAEKEAASHKKKKSKSSEAAPAEKSEKRKLIETAIKAGRKPSKKPSTRMPTFTLGKRYRDAGNRRDVFESAHADKVHFPKALVRRIIREAISKSDFGGNTKEVFLPEATTLTIQRIGEKVVKQLLRRIGFVAYKNKFKSATEFQFVTFRQSLPEQDLFHIKPSIEAIPTTKTKSNSNNNKKR